MNLILSYSLNHILLFQDRKLSMMPTTGGLQGGLTAADLESGAANSSQLLQGANRMEKQE